MSIFMWAYDYEMWDVVLDGPYFSMKTKVESEALEPKLRSEWIELEVKKVQVNFKAINTLHCALNPMEFNHISTCKTAKEIWHFSPTNTKCSKFKQMRASRLGLTGTQLS